MSCEKYRFGRGNDLAKVSVIVPVYNTEKYLKQCVNSLIKQSFSDVEIICVDDGSVDSSPDILDSFEKTYKRVKVIHKENKGYGHTVNTGISCASGEYIGVVDSDDLVPPDMYGFLFENADKNDLDFIKSDFYEIRTYRDKIYRKRIKCFEDPVRRKICNKVTDIGTYKDDMLPLFRNIWVWTGIYRREFLMKNDIMFNETPGAAFQDNGFWFKVLCMAGRGMFSDQAFYRYRKDNPASSVNDKSKVYDILEEYRCIKEFLAEHPEKYHSSFKAFVIQKYYAYMDTYARIDRKYKLDFLKRCAEEFSDDLKELETLNGPVGPEDLESLDKHAFCEMLRITDSPEIYYYESTLDECSREYETLQKDLEMLKRFAAREERSKRI